jgi:hypothetical protein
MRKQNFEDKSQPEEELCHQYVYTRIEAFIFLSEHKLSQLFYFY